MRRVTVTQRKLTLMFDLVAFGANTVTIATGIVLVVFYYHRRRRRDP
jgi:hypothetical protein